MQLFFNSEISSSNTAFTFDKEESRHIIKVLRKNIGDTLHITNGNGFLFKAQLSIADLKRCEVKIIDTQFSPHKSANLHLAVAPTKMNDRYEWFLEKATEIGISEITPIICDNSERKIVKTERFKKIIQSAMKQSLQLYLPKLNEPITFKDFIDKKFNNTDLFIAHCEENKKQDLKDELNPKSNALILIGPEGDFSTQEIETALNHNFKAISLGQTRLRTETAAVVACHTFNLLT